MTMREIKFRAWHTRNNEMVNFDINKVCKDNYQQQHLCNLMRGDHDDVLMQFTGLQDKNGVDIYEGDITKSVSEVLRPFDRSVKTRTGEYVTKYRAVDYQSKNARFGFAGKEYTSISQKHATKWLEVVGNIHSDPELLEK